MTHSESAECGGHARDRCMNARTERCACACGGANHGRRMRDQDVDRNMELTPIKMFSGESVQALRKLAPGADLDIRLWRSPSGRALVNIPQSLVYHSQSGFEWGYAGSGPAELALNILHLFVKAPEAMRLHQEFKTRYIELMPADGGVIRAAQVMDWIKNVWDREWVQRMLQL